MCVVGSYSVSVAVGSELRCLLNYRFYDTTACFNSLIAIVHTVLYMYMYMYNDSTCMYMYMYIDCTCTLIVHVHVFC